MVRFGLSLAALLAAVTTASAHFPYIVPAADGTKLMVVFSDELQPDKNVAIDKIAGLKLQVRGVEGQDAALPHKVGEHQLDVDAPAKGSQVVHGSLSYGVLSRGGAKPFLLMYHPKLILKGATSTALGKSAAIEIVPVGEPGTTRFRVDVAGQPAKAIEVHVTKPDGASEKTTTDDEGLTPAFAPTGRYALWAKVSEAKPGKFDDKEYQEVRHYATLVTDVGTTLASLPKLPVAISSFGAAMVDGKVYVYGGHQGKAHRYSTESVTGTLQRLDPQAKPLAWEKLPGGPGLQGLALVAHGGKLYRIGGMQPRNAPGEKSDNHSVATCALFDPATQQWEPLPDLPAGRSSHDAVVVDNTIVVVGGWQMKGTDQPSVWHDSIATLDLNQKPLVWKTAPQPFQRRALTAASFGGKVYVIAGLPAGAKPKRQVDIYDPATGTWSQGPELPGADLNGFTPASCVAKGRLLVTVADGSILRLSSAGDSWEKLGELEQARFVHRMVTLNDGRVAVLGGGSHDGTVDRTEVLPAALGQ